MKFESDRHFQMWDYTVSHQQLLVRSPADSEIVDNIDLVFWGVRFIGIPTSLAGAAIWEASPPELAHLAAGAAGKFALRGAFCVLSGDNTYFIAASGLVVHRNQLDIFDSSLMYFNAPDSDKPRGEKLAYFVWGGG
jgi:hypothetical protein